MQLFPLHFSDKVPYSISTPLQSLVKGCYGTPASQSLFPSAPTGSLNGSLFFGGAGKINDSVLLGLQSLLVARAKRLVKLKGT